MKKILFIIFVSFLLASCSDKPSDSDDWTWNEDNVENINNCSSFSSFTQNDVMERISGTNGIIGVWKREEFDIYTYYGNDIKYKSLYHTYKFYNDGRYEAYWDVQYPNGAGLAHRVTHRKGLYKLNKKNDQIILSIFKTEKIDQANYETPDTYYLYVSASNLYMKYFNELD